MGYAGGRRKRRLSAIQRAINQLLDPAHFTEKKTPKKKVLALKRIS